MPKYMYLKTEHGTVLIASMGFGNDHMSRHAPGLQEAQQELVQLGEKTGLCDIRFKNSMNLLQIHNGLWIDLWKEGQLKTGIFLLDFDCFHRERYRFQG